jgi:putative transcriptional regulator
MLVRTESRDSLGKLNLNQRKTWHYTLAKVTPHSKQNQRLSSRDPARTVEDGVETIRNWEQGKRMPRGPARALLAVIAHAPETVFAALARA